ncbi:glycine/betaine ABC transporter substrate-binding protein [Lentibacillus amyloliquefaciens]|uniref:Glycine/betaine ABC transporter substrate-binding protein n=2 Tax=Lentibacillus amyloliquefaciens TaxID=1472767 RepID=A0A0U4FSB3_9BACI|nr:glycine/betaine ABC transporter substrate-binding protein [Lentibacillus amyloliquefaciens]
MRFLGIAAIMLLLVVLAACGGSGSNESSESNGDNGGSNKETSNEEGSNESSNGDTVSEIGQKELTIPYVAWSSAVASNHVMEVVLEEAGYDVTLKQVNSGAMYTSVSDGSADATVCVWLPHTDASYWEEYKEDLEHLGPNLEGAPLGLVVPEYMDVNSIEDLKNNTNSVGDNTDYTITGIEPGAGQMKLTEEEVMPEYGLDDWTLQASSSATMATSLGDAIENEEPIVVTLWSPHWTFSEYDLKYLEDPKNIYGDPDNINTIVRKGLKEDAPKAQKILDQFKWSKDQIGEVMVKINEGMDPAKAAEEWVSNNQDAVSEWTKGTE